MSDTTYVMFCCNDPDNGALTDRISGLDLGDTLRITGDANYRELGRSVKIGRFTYPLESGIQTWVGNWCWNGAQMQVGILAALLERLRQDEWDIEEGAEELFNAWDRGEPITEALLRQALGSGSSADVGEGDA